LSETIHYSPPLIGHKLCEKHKDGSVQHVGVLQTTV